MKPSDSPLAHPLVIPVYNEFGVIETTHAKISAVLDGLPYDFEILYVDDGSSDGTDAIADGPRRAG
jgi:polyisoprenyl-phosphate glycosyltransferase